jgi:predicted  nucleic acid-binding Zn-ribbon protein
VNAPPATQLRLLDLQALDTTLDQLAHRRRTLPEHAEVERLTTRLTELGNEIVTTETEVGDIAREQSKSEADVEQVVSRADRDQKRLDAGQVSSPKELENLQSEIASLSRRRGDLEDVLLEVMERAEDAQGRLGTLTTDRSTVEAELATVTEKRDAAVAEIDAQGATTATERATVVAEIPADLLGLYEKIREAQGGVGAAQLHRGRCEGCHLSLDASSLAEIRAAAEDAVVRCEECRRILVRTAESGL